MTTSATFTNLTASFADRYRIERELGAGGMATVYLAHDVKHDRKVAIKVLKPELAAVLGGERFVVEIKTTASLTHPHILPLFDSGTTTSHPDATGGSGGSAFLYYVMPYIQGETVRERLNRETQFGVDEAIRIAREVADALDYAHRHGVIHRDIKPENILLHDGRAMVMDFGIALAVSAAAGGRMTETGLSLGTPHYMSPEQATAEKDITPRSDIYSLASVLYEMLAGQPPHVAGSAQQVIMKIITEPAKPVTSLRKSVPAHVSGAVDKALEKLPADRFFTAHDFAEALSGAHPVPSETRSDGSIVASRRRSVMARMRETTLAVIALAGIAGTIYFATRHPQAPVTGRFNVELPDGVSLYESTGPNLALSRDGSQLVVVGARLDGGHALYLRRLDDPMARPIDGTDGGDQPTFSYDGSSLLFRVNTKLVRVPVAGGYPRTVVDSVNYQATAWGPDDQILFSRDRSLWSVSANGGEARQLVAPDSIHGIGSISEPEFLPGGGYALVSIHKSRFDFGGSLGVVSIADGTVTQLGIAGVNAHYVAPGFIAFARNGEEFAAPFSLRRRSVTGEPVRFLDHIQGTSYGRFNVAFAQNGTLAVHSRAATTRLGMYIVDRGGVERAAAADNHDGVLDPRISPDGRRVVARIGSGAGSGDLWILELATGARTRITTNGRSWRADWSADGKRIDYLSGPDLGSHVVSRPWDQSGDERILLSAESTGPRASLQGFSGGPPRGYSAVRVGSRRASQSADIWIAPSDSLHALRPFLTSAFDELQPRVSPDGKLLAYMSNESGHDEVYLTKLPGPAAHVIVSLNGGSEPAWSSDGTTLFYRGNSRLMAATLASKGESTIARRDSLFVDQYYRYNGVTEYDVFPDKQHFLMLRSIADRSAGSDVSVIVNWPRMLERVAPGKAQ